MMKKIYRPSTYIVIMLTCMVAIFSAIWFYCFNFRSNILSGSFGEWRANINSVYKCDTKQIAILGSSQASVGYLPRELGLPAKNYALQASTPIEGYYQLKRLYACPRPPTAFILSYSGADFVLQTWFWERAAGFGMLKYGDLNEVARNSRALGDTSLYPGTFGSEPPPEMKNWLYAYHFPPYDFASLLVSGLGRYRRRINDRMTAETTKNDGQHIFGPGLCATNTTSQARQLDFEPKRINAFYFDKMLEMLHMHHANVIFIAPPISQISYSMLKGPYRQHYTAFVEGFKRHNPEIVILDPLFKPYNNCYFSDASHLNSVGIHVFDKTVGPEISNILKN